MSCARMLVVEEKEEEGAVAIYQTLASTHANANATTQKQRPARYHIHNNNIHISTLANARANESFLSLNAA